MTLTAFQKLWLVVLLSLLWGIVAWRWYTCGVRHFCELLPAFSSVATL